MTVIIKTKSTLNLVRVSGFRFTKSFLYFILDKPDPLRFEIPGNKTGDASERIAVKRGQPFSIQCRVSGVDGLGIPKGTLKWFRENRSAVVASSSGDQTFINLDFETLEKENNGSYTCRINNTIGEQSKNLQLIVLGEVSYTFINTIFY